MASVDDVAAAVLDLTGRIDTFKLQKLVYYCQAWHLVWEDRPLFTARIEAWANGPVIPKLYRQHRGSYRVNSWASGDAGRLNGGETETVEIVVGEYNQFSGQQLSDMTHREHPWRDARSGLRPGDRGDAEITLGALLEYYGGLIDPNA